MSSPSKSTAIAVTTGSKQALGKLRSPNSHMHVYEGKNQQNAEFRVWAVFWLCFLSMVVEIVCGALFGSIALIADGIHMGTHCTAFVITAYGYSFCRNNRYNKKYSFGPGKITDLASYTSAIILVFVALIIMYDAVYRFIVPEKISFKQAFPVAFVGIFVNVMSGIILTCRFGKNPHGDEHDHDMAHGHSHGHANEHYEYELVDDQSPGSHGDHDHGHDHGSHKKHDHGGHDGHDHGHDHGGHDDHDHGHDHGGHDDHDHDNCHGHGHEHEEHSLEAGKATHGGHDHGDCGHSLNKAHSADSNFHNDNSYTAAICHVVADAFVSLLLVGALLIIHYYPSAHYLDPIVAIIGSFVILSWSRTLMMDCSANLLDTNPDLKMTEALRKHLEKDGTSKVSDLHIWRLGPGHLGCIVSIDTTDARRNRGYYMRKLVGFKALSHITIEIHHVSISNK